MPPAAHDRRATERARSAPRASRPAADTRQLRTADLLTGGRPPRPGRIRSRQSAKLVPQPQEAVAFGLWILKA